jgi:hypothetical protein
MCCVEACPSKVAERQSFVLCGTLEKSSAEQVSILCLQN